MSSHRTNSSLCPLATFFSAPSGFEERKTAMISVGSTGAGLGFHCKSILSFAGTRHQAQTSNANMANDELFMGFSTSYRRQRGWPKAYSESGSGQRAAGWRQRAINTFPPITAGSAHGAGTAEREYLRKCVSDMRRNQEQTRQPRYGVLDAR